MSVNTGCDSVATLDLSVTFLDAPTLSSSGPVQCSGDLIEITMEDIPNAEYHWNGPNGYFSEEAYNEFELNYTNEGIYTAYYSLNSCVSEVAELELGIENFEIDEFTFPNVITANNDGVNDEITVEDYIGYCEEFNFSIRDRWGNQVFEQERGEESFNGVSFVGEKLPEGVYFYHLSYGMKSLSGFIHIFE
jgi:gliding motility-associated-like protein